MKQLIIVMASFLLAFNVFADNKSDQIEKEIRILKQQVEALGNNRLDPIFSANAAEDKVSAFLTLSGYIEMSAGKSSLESEFGDIDSTFMNVGIVEFVFDFDFSDQLSATIHVTSEANVNVEFSDDENYDSSLSALVIEEANFTWSFSQVDGLSITVGIQDINVGLEATEAVDLVQYSRASYNNVGGSAISGIGVMPAYAQGFTLTYDNEQFTVSVGLYDNFDNVSILSSAVNDFISIPVTGDHDGNIDEFAYLISGSFKLGESGSISAAYGSSESDEEDSVNGSSLEYDFFNLNGVYAINQFEIAAEYVQADLDFYGIVDVEVMGYLLRGTYKINDKWSVSLRYDVTEIEVDFGTTVDADITGFAISGSVIVSENLLIIAEFGQREYELSGLGGSTDIDEDWFVVEAYITF